MKVRAAKKILKGKYLSGCKYKKSTVNTAYYKLHKRADKYPGFWILADMLNIT